eukprot:GHVN01015934.1.p1 GENE.GHVN01015934.1~~GHVN01015934.1.p1  ORF type:complete len:145 (-),score=27.35 GHVN01015934.1:329-763(-)
MKQMIFLSYTVMLMIALLATAQHAPHEADGNGDVDHEWFQKIEGDYDTFRASVQSLWDAHLKEGIDVENLDKEKAKEAVTKVSEHISVSLDDLDDLVADQVAGVMDMIEDAFAFYTNDEGQDGANNDSDNDVSERSCSDSCVSS